MLEHQHSLMTWALNSAPEPNSSQTVQRLADHRITYLDYEGPISGDRGHVTRWDAGKFTWDDSLVSTTWTSELPPLHLSLHLNGTTLQARAELTCSASIKLVDDDKLVRQRWQLCMSDELATRD